MAKRTKQQAEKEKTHETSTVAKRTRQQTERENKRREKHSGKEDETADR